MQEFVLPVQTLCPKEESDRLLKKYSSKNKNHKTSIVSAVLYPCPDLRHDYGFILLKIKYMDIIIQHLGFTTSETLDAFIREKVNTLKSDKIVRANVTLYLASESNPENQVCEIRLEVPGNDYFVKKGSVHFETAVTECVDILQNKIKKQHDRNINQRQASEDIIQDELLSGQDDDQETELEDVVK